MGRLFKFLEEAGRLHDTMIVFTSDHGDYLGDHWMGEKELFHEQSARVPLIIYDPSPKADATRGTVSSRFVEALDLLPTFLNTIGAPIPSHRLEGRSLLPLLHGGDISGWRDQVFSEIDYAFYQARQILDVGASEARGYMIRTERWKYVYFKHFPPQPDRRGRVYVLHSMFKPGLVRFPKDAPFMRDVENELLSYPYGQTDDIVDSISLVLNYKPKTFDYANF